MADKIIGINLNGIDYDYEDEETSSQTEENTSKIGDLTDLETTAKTDLVSAINEVNSKSAELLFIDITDLMSLVSSSGWGDPPRLSVCKLSNALGTVTIRTAPLYENEVGSAGSISYECLNSAELASRLSSIFGSRWDSFSTGQFLYLQKSSARYVEDYMAEDFALQNITLLITKNSNTSATARLTMNNSVMVTVVEGTHDGDELLLTADFVY